MATDSSVSGSSTVADFEVAPEAVAVAVVGVLVVDVVGTAELFPTVKSPI